VTENRDRNISNYLKKMNHLFKKIKEEEADEGTAFKSYYLATELIDWTPDEALMDAVLKVDDLQTINEFAKIYGDCEIMLTYEDPVWPVLHDGVPFNIYETNLYDVNLIFGKRSEKQQL